MDILFTNFYLFTLAVTLSALEIQIEGKDGWAGKLPTWRPSTSLWYTKAYIKLLSGKELTGYHIVFFLLILLMFHIPYVFGVPFTLFNEVRTLSLMLMVMITEDFMWFVLNPAFGIKRFFSKQVPWHEKRILFFPPEYFFTLFLSFVVLLPLLMQGTNVILWWIINFLTFFLLVLITVLFTMFRNRR
jgi:hypothetical protein